MKAFKFQVVPAEELKCHPLLDFVSLTDEAEKKILNQS